MFQFIFVRCKKWGADWFIHFSLTLLTYGTQAILDLYSGSNDNLAQCNWSQFGWSQCIALSQGKLPQYLERVPLWRLLLPAHACVLALLSSGPPSEDMLPTHTKRGGGVGVKTWTFHSVISLLLHILLGNGWNLQPPVHCALHKNIKNKPLIEKHAIAKAYLIYFFVHPLKKIKIARMTLKVAKTSVQ